MFSDYRSEEHHLTAKGRVVKERIVHSATQIILDEGLNGLSITKVRHLAGVSGSQITHYFEDKASLVRAVLDEQIENVMAIHRQPSLGNLTTWEQWESWANVNVSFLRKFGYSGRPTYHGLAGQLAKTDSGTREVLAGGYQRWSEFFEGVLTRMRSDGVLIASADPQLLAIVLVGTHQGGACLSFTYRQAWPLANATRFFVNHLRSFAADPAERAPHLPQCARDQRRPLVVSPSPAAARRLTRKGMATRERIVDDAAELMYEHGVRNTTLDDVRKKSGASGSQLSHYFNDKADLTRQVIATRSAATQSFLRREEFEGLSSIAALRRFAEACLERLGPMYSRGGCPYGSLVGELMDADDVIRDELIAGYDLCLQHFGDALAAMKRTGELGARADARHLAVILLAAHQGGAMLTQIARSADPCTYLLRAAIDHICSFSSTPEAAGLVP
jgi:AcrR family transcriptional regulator